MPQSPEVTKAPGRSRALSLVMLGAGILLAWGLIAYVGVPLVWKAYASRHPDFDDNPRLTQTGDHHPGDPLNVAFIGSTSELHAAMKEAKWFPAAALSLKSDLRIAADSVLSRPDDDAPVSSLYLFGRKEDLAFEQPVGDNPRHRHHVRLWKTPEATEDGRPKWIGSAVYDERVGLSRTTGEITHVTAPDVDTERDYLFSCLKTAGALSSTFVVPGFHEQHGGKNGGGDPWRTDGSLYVGILATGDP